MAKRRFAIYEGTISAGADPDDYIDGSDEFLPESERSTDDERRLAREDFLSVRAGRPSEDSAGEIELGPDGRKPRSDVDDE